jgi:hypothetical protein
MDMNNNSKTAKITAFVLIPLGAWVALAPFVVGTWAWEWHLGRFLLAVLPGAVTVIGGLMLLTGRARLASVGGACALGGGLWFVFAPLVYAFVAGGDFGTTPGGESVRLAQWLPFLFVGGGLIALLSSYAIGLVRPLEFGDEAWAETEAASKRARMPLPTERPRRQRAVREPLGGTRSRSDGPARRDR